MPRSLDIEMIETPSSAYIHIPFCRRKCLYCDFTSYPGRESLFGEYTEALVAEIRAASGKFPLTNISTLYVGGGTPNILPIDLISLVLDEIRPNPTAEMSIEANPGIKDGSSFRELKTAGFNRLSLGFQSFHDRELRQLGRIHTSGEAVRAFDDANEAGFENIGIDLMYGIPGQTPASWRETIEKALEPGPQHISLYSLTIEEGTPFHDMSLDLPGEDAEADMYEVAIQILTDAGYVHYEISNFALPGFECRHNINYWKNDQYFGFGAGATSYIEGTRATNSADLEEYIKNPGVPAFSEHLTGRRSMGETMFLGLRMLEGVDIEAFQARYKKDPFDIFNSEINRLADLGFIRFKRNRIMLTKKGLFFANEAFSEFV